MKHSSTQELFDYWDLQRGRRPAPERDMIEPGPIRKILADTFILGIDARLGHPFKLAGTRVCALFGRELKGEAFIQLWTPESRPLIADLFSVVTGESIGISAGASSDTKEGKLDLELLLLPLALHGRLDARIVGALVPTTTPYWLGNFPIASMEIGAIRYIGESAGIQPALPSPQDEAEQTEPAMRKPITALAHPGGGRIRRGLIVYDGDRR